MRTTLLVGWLGVALAAQQASQGLPLSVEVRDVPGSMYVHESRTFVVRIAFDAQWLATSAVPLFPQRLDLPFHIALPWLDQAADRAVTLLPPATGAAVLQVAVGDRVAAVARATGELRDGRTWDVVELRCRWQALAAGAGTVPPVAVRCAFATRFVDDFLRGRQPADRHEATVASAPLPLLVEELPAAPPGFSGAVGEFALSAAVATGTTAVGESVRVTVTLTGDGNLGRLPPLPAPRLPGFHVQGVAEQAVATGRQFVLDVVPLRAGLTQLPAIPFVAFLPRTKSFATVHSAPLPLVVGAAAGPLPPRLQALVDAEAANGAADAGHAWRWPFGAALAAVLGSLLLRRRRRRAAQARTRAALDRLAAAFADGPAAVLGAFEQLLAVAAGRVDYSPAVLVELAVHAGAAKAEELRALHAALDHARFGGAAPEQATVLAAVAAFARR